MVTYQGFKCNALLAESTQGRNNFELNERSGRWGVRGDGVTTEPDQRLFRPSPDPSPHQTNSGRVWLDQLTCSMLSSWSMGGTNLVPTFWYEPRTRPLFFLGFSFIQTVTVRFGKLNPNPRPNAIKASAPQGVASEILAKFALNPPARNCAEAFKTLSLGPIGHSPPGPSRALSGVDPDTLHSRTYSRHTA
jgi:hypothetical protein